MGIFSSKQSYNNNNNYQNNKIISNKSVEYNQKFKQLLININKNDQIDKQDKQIIKQELQKIKNTYNQQTEYDIKIRELTKEKNKLVGEKGMKVRNTSGYEFQFQKIMQNINSNDKLSPKSKKYIKDELLKMKKFNKNKNISYNKKLFSITSKKNILTKNVIPNDNINVNIYWVRHGFSCANLEEYKKIIFKQANPNLSDLGCYGLLAQQLNLTNITPNSPIQIPRPSGSAAGGAINQKNHEQELQELQILKDKLANNQIDLFGASQLLRAIQTQAILFAPFNNGNEIQVLPYISEEGSGKDNEPENQEITKEKLKNSLIYFKSRKYMNINKNYNLNYEYSKNITEPNLDKFYNETLPLILNEFYKTKGLQNLYAENKNKQNKNEFNFIIVSHQNFMKSIVKKYKLINEQQSFFDENKTKIPNQSILLQKLKLSVNDFKQNNIQQEKIILLSPSNFNVPMSYFVPKRRFNYYFLSNKNKNKLQNNKYSNSQKNWFYYFVYNCLNDLIFELTYSKNENNIKIFEKIILDNEKLEKIKRLLVTNKNKVVPFNLIKSYLQQNYSTDINVMIENKYNKIMEIMKLMKENNININISDLIQNSALQFFIFENNPNVIDFGKQINEIIKLSKDSQDLFNVLFESCDNLPSIFNRSRTKDKFKKQFI